MISDPHELLKLMGTINYDNFTDEEDYIVRTPKEVLRDKLGICYDQIELQKFFLKKMGYKFQLFFAYEKLPITDNPTHTFLIFEKNNKYFWFETSWGTYHNIHGPFNSYEDAVKYVAEQLKTASKWKKVYVVKYDSPPKGLNINQFGEYILKRHGKGKKIL